MVPGHGGGSGLPGLHIGSDTAYATIGMGGSAFAPRTGPEIDVDGYTAITGGIEDGQGIRIIIDLPECEFITLSFYGTTQAEVDAIATGLTIEAS